jgi:hypothetical protein
LLGDIIDTASVPGEDLFMRAAAMPAGLTRRRRGLRSAKPEADGRVVASMATMAKVTEVRRRFNIIVDIIINCYFDGMFLAFDFMMREVVVEVQESEWLGRDVQATQSHHHLAVLALFYREGGRFRAGERAACMNSCVQCRLRKSFRTAFYRTELHQMHFMYIHT